MSAPNEPRRWNACAPPLDRDAASSTTCGIFQSMVFLLFVGLTSGAPRSSQVPGSTPRSCATRNRQDLRPSKDQLRNFLREPPKPPRKLSGCCAGRYRRPMCQEYRCSRWFTPRRAGTGWPRIVGNDAAVHSRRHGSEASGGRPLNHPMVSRPSLRIPRKCRHYTTTGGGAGPCDGQCDGLPSG